MRSSPLRLNTIFGTLHTNLTDFANACYYEVDDLDVVEFIKELIDISDDFNHDVSKQILKYCSEKVQS